MGKTKSKFKSGLAKRLIKSAASYSKEQVMETISEVMAGNVEGFSVTPKGMFIMALMKYYGINAGDGSKFDKFSEFLLSSLSKLASENRRTDLCGENFNDFFAIYVNTLNMCGKMREKLEENGIDFDQSDME